MWVRSTNTPSHLDRGGSGLVVYNVTNGTNSGWKHDNNWWYSGGLSVNTNYGFRAKARNRAYVETGYCSIMYRYTLAMRPNADCFTDIDVDKVRANWTANGNPAGTAYYCENMTTGANSGWTTATYWFSGGLSPDTLYEFRVKARNGDGVETSWRYLGKQLTMGPDTDGDGMSDAWEMSYFGTLKYEAEGDEDNDGSTNFEEFAAGANPIDDSSFFAIVNITRQSSGDIILEYTAIEGKQYAVEFSDDDMDPGMTWITAQDFIVANSDGVYEWEDDGSLTVVHPRVPIHRYYRMKVYGPYGCN